MNIQKLIFSFVFIFGSLPTQSYVRVPENLAGTDVFTDNIVKLTKKDSKNADERVEEIELPLKSLNLYYGAEFFHTLAQVFYKNGNLVELKQEELLEEPSTARTSAAP